VEGVIVDPLFLDSATGDAAIEGEISTLQGALRDEAK
jgi:hypothetical protein